MSLTEFLQQDTAERYKAYLRSLVELAAVLTTESTWRAITLDGETYWALSEPAGKQVYGRAWEAWQAVVVFESLADETTDWNALGLPDAPLVQAGIGNPAVSLEAARQALSLYKWAIGFIQRSDGWAQDRLSELTASVLDALAANSGRVE